MKKLIKKILVFLLFALIVIQFIHPKPNKATGDQPNYIGKVICSSRRCKNYS